MNLSNKRPSNIGIFYYINQNNLVSKSQNKSVKAINITNTKIKIKSTHYRMYSSYQQSSPSSSSIGYNSVYNQSYLSTSPLPAANFELSDQPSYYNYPSSSSFVNNYSNISTYSPQSITANSSANLSSFNSCSLSSTSSPINYTSFPRSSLTSSSPDSYNSYNYSANSSYLSNSYYYRPNANTVDYSSYYYPSDYQYSYSNIQFVSQNEKPSQPNFPADNIEPNEQLPAKEKDNIETQQPHNNSKELLGKFIFYA
jgi:hypothetical protein